MQYRTQIIGLLAFMLAFVPAFTFAQSTQEEESGIQTQIDQVRQETQQLQANFSEYFDGKQPEDFEPMPMPEADEGPNQGSTEPSPGNVSPDRDSTNPSPSAIKNQIQDITPQRGDEDTEIKVKIDDNELVTESDDWNVHFGDTTIDQRNIRISVPLMYSPNGSVQGYLKFSAPEELEPGTYDVWISGDGYATNRVEFTLLNETGSTDPNPGNVNPDQGSTEPSPGNVRPEEDNTEPNIVSDPPEEFISLNLSDTYKDTFEFTATLRYHGDNTWKYAIEGSVPSPCHNLETDYYESTKQLAAWITPPSESTSCTTVVDEVSAEGTLNAEHDADIQFEVEENTTSEPTDDNLEEVPTEGDTETTQQDDETTAGNTDPEPVPTEPTSESTGPQGGTTEQPTEVNMDPTRETTDNSDNAAIEAALQQVRQQVQTLVDQVSRSNN